MGREWRDGRNEGGRGEEREGRERGGKGMIIMDARYATAHTYIHTYTLA